MNTQSVVTFFIVTLLWLVDGCVPMPQDLSAEAASQTHRAVVSTVTFEPEQADISVAQVHLTALEATELPSGFFYRTALSGSTLYGAGRQVSGKIALYMIDLDTGYVRQVGSLGDDVNSMRASGRYMVWNRSENDVLVYDRQTDRETLIVTGARDPDVSGDMVVWTDWRNVHQPNSLDIYGYHLISKEVLPIITRPEAQAHPRIFGQWVIYLDSITQDTADIYAHHLSTDEDFKIGTMPMRGLRLTVVSWYPEISGNRVAWVSAQDERVHIYTLDTRSDRVLPIRIPSSLVLNDDILTYHTVDGKKWEGYDLTREITFTLPITLAVSHGQRVGYASPAWISGDRLVWEIALDERPNIYTAHITR